MATITVPARPPRTPESQQRPPAAAPASQVNVGESERWLSLLGGSVLALYGLSRGSLGGLGLGLLGGSLLYRGATGHCQAYAALNINTSDHRTGHTSIPAGRGVKVESALTVQRTPEELYRFWHNFENLPRFMYHLELVQSTGGNRSHWVARGPLQSRLSWDAEIITDRPNEVIGWRSLPGSQVDTAGSVHFTPAPGNRGTEVKVILKYDPPAGQVGATLAWLLGEAPEQEIREDLRRFKRFLETGEVPTTEGQPSGRGRERWQQTGNMVLEHRFASGLGWFSMGLGLAELLAPSFLGEVIGIEDHEALLRLLGAREVASGLGILSGQRPTAAVWSRVVGDAMDLTLLGAALTSPRNDRARVLGAFLAVAGVTAADLLCSLQLSRTPHELAGRIPKPRIPEQTHMAGRTNLVSGTR